MGLAATAILLVNNLRDIATDTAAGKRTLAVRIGAARTRRLYGACLWGAVLSAPGLALWAPGALVGVLAAPLTMKPMRIVSRPDAPPPELVVALIGTARFELVLAVLLTLGMWNW
jgi:1,4-dihydroxy-2-naphthoate octaprenyltransferase